MALNNSLKNLAIHLDKIAYGTAAVLGIFILLCPNIFTGNLNYSDIEEYRSLITKRKDVPVIIPPVQSILDTLQKQWIVLPPIQGTWIPGWSHEIHPGVVQIVDTVVEQKPTHEAGKVVKISYNRDKDRLKVFIHVTAEKPAAANKAELKSVKLLRKVISTPPAANADFAEVKVFAPADEVFQFDDFDVKPGNLYAYRLDSEAAIDPKAKINDEDKAGFETNKSSNELVTKSPIPWDYAIKILSALPYDEKTGTAATLTGEITWWDYLQGKVVKSQKMNWKEGDVFGHKGKNNRERHAIQRIESGQITVVDRSTPTLDKETLKTSDNKRPVELPGEVVYEEPAPATSADATGAGADAEPVVEEKAAKKAAAKPAEEEEEPPAAKKKAAPKDTSKKDPKSTKSTKKKPAIK